MEQYELKEMLTHVADGSVSVEEAVRRLKRAPFEEIGIASLDAHRGIRQGASEIVYGAGKTAAQIVKIAETLRSGGQQTILITRVDAEKAEAVREALAADVPFTYFEEGRIGLSARKPRRGVRDIFWWRPAEPVIFRSRRRRHSRRRLWEIRWNVFMTWVSRDFTA